MARSFFTWAQMSWWGTTVRESTWGFAGASIVLLFGIVLLVGGVFLMSLRLLGLIMRDRPVSRVARDLRRWTLVGLVMTLVSGTSMWAGHGIMPDLYESSAFWLEMELLLAALAFHFTLYRWVTNRDDAPPALRGFTAVLALFLWFGVGVAGRAIGFF
ncbi:MAG TPA: DUF6644 family protein [Vicinamibacterales bacterium]|jgi:hypothetical protein